MKKITARGSGEPQPLREAGTPTHSEDRVDLTLIRWMLSLTPGERLQILQAHLASIQELRGEIPEGSYPLKAEDIRRLRERSGEVQAASERSLSGKERRAKARSSARRAAGSRGSRAASVRRARREASR